MNCTVLTNEDRIAIAEAVSKEINERFGLSIFEMSLNDLNQNICIKMLKSEAAEDVLSAIAESLSINLSYAVCFHVYTHLIGFLHGQSVSEEDCDLSF